MALISCPECGGQLSSAAEACPHCGYPIRETVAESPEPSCYACSVTATTRCQKCGKFSCATHLEPIFVHYGKGGSSELRCQSCFKQAKEENRTLGNIVVVSLALLAVFLVIGGVFWNAENERSQKELERIRKQTDPILKKYDQKQTQHP